MAGSGRLQVNPDCFVDPSETDFRKINDAINGVSQQAFAPFSAQAIGSVTNETFDSTSYATITGLSIDLVVPVPSRVVVTYSLRCTCSTYAAGETLFTALYRDGSIIVPPTQIWMPAAVDTSVTQSFSYMESDLVPETTYAYTVRARVNPRTTGVYTISGIRSTLILRVEGRQRF